MSEILNELFADKRVEAGSHVVMKSVGVESDKYKGYVNPPVLDQKGQQSYAIFAKTNIEAMKVEGWELVEQVVEPEDAAPKATKTKQ